MLRSCCWLATFRQGGQDGHGRRRARGPSRVRQIRTPSSQVAGDVSHCQLPRLVHHLAVATSLRIDPSIEEDRHAMGAAAAVASPSLSGI